MNGDQICLTYHKHYKAQQYQKTAQSKSPFSFFDWWTTFHHFLFSIGFSFSFSARLNFFGPRYLFTELGKKFIFLHGINICLYAWEKTERVKLCVCVGGEIMDGQKNLSHLQQTWFRIDEDRSESKLVLKI